MKKKEIVRAIAIILIPGGIPVYLGYKAYQFGKWVHRKKKEDRERSYDENDNDENVG